MFSVADTVKRVLEEQGRTQTWIIKGMNTVNPALAMNRNKFSSIANGRRKMTGDELLAFCQVMEISPDEFLPKNASKEGG